MKNKDLKLEHTYMKLPKNLFSMQLPSKVPNPECVIVNTQLAKELGLEDTVLGDEKGLQIFAGNEVIDDQTIAQAYGGHQFGYFTKLGDGRAILLGEYIARDGERYDIQLKGSGRTPYSRGGDGKAALGPMLREYIISEGMHALGIPTTRSLAVIKTGEIVMRETPLEGAILTRIAKSYIRVGTFQYVAKWGTTKELKALADYTLDRHFKGNHEGENPYLYLLKEVVAHQARLVSKWQLVGFIHGVLNTDNVALSGETIDYGPCAFMDTYNLNTVFSSIDREGRYAYKNQPSITGWNLARFAETLLPLLHEDRETAIKLAQEVISSFGDLYRTNWYEGMAHKLGLFEKKQEDEKLMHTLLELMEEHKADYTNTFRNLTLGILEGTPLFESEAFKNWYAAWQERLGMQSQSKEEVQKLMKQNNPAVIPRNHKVEEALQLATIRNDYSKVEKLVEIIKHPYDYHQVDEDYIIVPAHASCGYKTYCGT